MKITRTTVLAVLALLIAHSLPPTVQAAERFTGEVKKEELKKRLDLYMKASTKTLANLSKYAEVSAKGDRSMHREWAADSARMLGMVQTLKSITKDDSEAKTWYDNEVKTWQNIQKIGSEMMEMHWYLAATAKDVEEDIKDSEQFFDKLETYLDKANGAAGKFNRAIKKANQYVGDFSKLKSATSDIPTILGLMKDHSQTIGRVIKQFKKRQLGFIKDRGKVSKHRDAVAKLKSYAIDSDQKGDYVAHEKNWEASMLKTFHRYEDAVEEWHKVNAWHKGNDHLADMLVKHMTALVNTGASTFLGAGLPGFVPKNEDDLAAYCDKVKAAYRKAAISFSGKVWDTIMKEIDTARQEMDDLRIDTEAEISKMEENARDKFAGVEEKYEVTERQLESKLNRLTQRIATEKEPSLRDAIARDIRSTEDEMDVEERALNKARHYHLEVWVRQQEEKIFKEYRKKYEELRDRIEKHNGDLKALDKAIKK